MDDTLEIAKKCGAHVFDNPLETETESWSKGDAIFSAKMLQSFREEIEKLERERCAKDAERYRWLKSRNGLDLRSDCGEWTRQDGTKFTSSHYLAEGDIQHAAYESLDETIDAAMRLRRSHP